MSALATLEALRSSGALVLLDSGTPLIRRARAVPAALLEQARAEKVEIADLLRAELAPLLAELEALADRWDRGVRWLEHGSDPDLAYRRFSELADQAGALVEKIEALAPGASHGLLDRLWAADDALLEAAA